jgi:hypothetical protein
VGSAYVASSGKVMDDDELLRMWKEAATLRYYHRTSLKRLRRTMRTSFGVVENLESLHITSFPTEIIDDFMCSEKIKY